MQRTIHQQNYPKLIFLCRSVEAMEGEGMGQFSEVKNLICIISFDIRGVHLGKKSFRGLDLNMDNFHISLESPPPTHNALANF